jgi:glycosyltransferase involved in cell wall biosynthesis
MKKIALMTWWHHHNFGTALQAAALYNTIKILGFEVDIVNYIPPQGGKISRFLRYRLPVFYGIYKNVNLTVKRMLGTRLIADSLRGKKYDEFLTTRLTFTNKCTTMEELVALNNVYNAFVCGSDQIWNPAYFNTHYFLDFVKNDVQKTAYAPSFGLSNVKNSAIKRTMYSLISRFKHLSVREEQGKKIIHELCNLEAEVVLDPALLLRYDEWREIIQVERTEENYILGYFLGPNNNAWEHVKNISRQLDLPVKIVPIFTKDRKHGSCINGAGPGEFFNLIDNAQCICTDSFHGALFSIICQKPFLLFERFNTGDTLSQNSRIYNLLEMTNLQDRLVCYNQPVQNNYQFDYDYSCVNLRIEEQKNKSIKYLHESLSEAVRIKPNVNPEPLVSVIVPVYNVEKYIKECLDSISNQTYRNIEIIVVDDGTPDNSGKIADECALKDKRIKVIHQENGGVSAARNAGLDLANGEYIIFVDSDDYLYPEYSEYMLNLIRFTQSDIAVSLNVYNEYTSKQVVSDRFEVYSPAMALQAIYLYRMSVAVWNKIFKRDFIEKFHLRFNTELWFGEGMSFNVLYFNRAARIGAGLRRIYFQRNNPESAVRKFRFENWECESKALEYQKSDLIKSGIMENKNVANGFNFHWWWDAFCVIHEIYKNKLAKEFPEAIKIYRTIIRKNILLAFFVPSGIKRKILNIIIFVSPKIASDIITKREAGSIAHAEKMCIGKNNDT